MNLLRGLLAGAVAVTALVGGPAWTAAGQPGPLDTDHDPGAPPGPVAAPGPTSVNGDASAAGGPAGGPAGTPTGTTDRPGTGSDTGHGVGDPGTPGPGGTPTAGPAASPSGTATAPRRANCPDIEVIFARGTDDSPGLGTPGTAFVNALRSRVGGRTVHAYPVNYPASYDFLAAADGATDATNRVAETAAQCPDTKLVLGGYSQGAAVIDMLAGVPPLGNKIGFVGSAPPLPASLVPHVAAVAVFGNPAAKFGNPITNSVFGGRAIDLCKDGDPICSRGRNPFAHDDYVSAGLVEQAADFVAGRV
ncbi:cutinase family protein [Mycolicibacterium hassiacum DSM 44199]|uniref:Cutinase n=1 Tax=Mycolicibacterium hassiacum (strain DSM 44199 / CIP 105218 / JCM 12690 / 3849) TaxID=1122247 RepID=K5B9T1_MYCHD|nr:cutinase family protein [Mycolicibacterium hassiacum DSM 44199]VCT88634.1 putative cutinase cut3 [Mycolicibacterium hassiacum DSM 44199]